MSRKAKMAFYQLSPYRVLQANPEKGCFRLIELNGILLQRSVIGNYIKKFYLYKKREERNNLIILIYKQPLQESEERLGLERDKAEFYNTLREDKEQLIKNKEETRFTNLVGNTLLQKGVFKEVKSVLKNFQGVFLQ